MSSRYFTLLASPLALVLPLAFAGCSASGDAGGSEIRRGSGGSGNFDPGTGSGNSGPTNTGTGGGTGLGIDTGSGMAGTGGASTCGQVLKVTYRDFKGSNEPGGHSDFEASGRMVKQTDGGIYKGWNDVGCGLVTNMLGTDSKPVAFTGKPDQNDGLGIPAGDGYQRRSVTGTGCWSSSNPNPTGVCNIGTCEKWTFAPPTWSIKDGNSFAQWYNTTPNVNMEIPGELMLTEMPAGSGVSVYDSNAFFPIDNQGFGNTPGQTHNYSFTTEIHVKFQYQKAQKFTFRGDDDLWIFVNGQLALDVGGQHQALEGTIDFDLQAAKLGITVGQTYAMDIFHAERQTTDSNFRIETNIRCFEPVTVVK
ncbi:MAG TPA: fibro-slime domain-containing protein [Polyangiaceae bacterium]|nr:fibro-slime domain-containing protein [Polyangiaceae bacterium]